MEEPKPSLGPHQAEPREGKPVAVHGLPWHSILSPHLEVIWAWRKANRTYREISALLEPLGIRVAHSTVQRFVEARKRRLRKNALPDLHGNARAAKFSKPRLVTKVSPATDKPRHPGPQTTNAGFPLADGREIIAHDENGRPLSRNKPFIGEI